LRIGQRTSGPAINVGWLFGWKDELTMDEWFFSEKCFRTGTSGQ